eukprot:355489-Chlamydomonas_euryale.AAC.8
MAGAAMTLSNAAFAAGGATPVDIFDDRKAREKGYDIIYEARDLDIPQAERDGLTQVHEQLCASMPFKRFSRKHKEHLQQADPCNQQITWMSHTFAGPSESVFMRPDTAARANLELTKKRIKEAETRIDGSVAKYTAKSYWTEAREELRRQVGTLRFDLNALAEIQPKEQRKTAQALNKEFLTKILLREAVAWSFVVVQHDT